MQNINVLLYNDFTTLDAFGPIEVLSKLEKHFFINFYSFSGGVIKGSGNTRIFTRPASEISSFDILLIPGGLGTRQLVNDDLFINQLRSLAEKSSIVLSVCTGSALLAKTGLLKKIRATSNKLAWDWVIQQDTEVNWIKKARWVCDGKYYTSSGITAGIDMALGFISDKFNNDVSKKISTALEYIWNNDRDNDPFC